MIALSLVLCFVFVSCSDDSESEYASSIPSNLYGTWYGSISGRDIYLKLKSDGTGEFQYSSLVYFRVANFTYKYKGNTIDCDGFIVGEDGVMNVFDQQFRYDPPYIYPNGMYSQYQLKKI